MAKSNKPKLKIESVRIKPLTITARFNIFDKIAIYSLLTLIIILLGILAVGRFVPREVRINAQASMVDPTPQRVGLGGPQICWNDMESDHLVHCTTMDMSYPNMKQILTDPNCILESAWTSNHQALFVVNPHCMPSGSTPDNAAMLSHKYCQQKEKTAEELNKEWYNLCILHK